MPFFPTLVISALFGWEPFTPTVTVRLKEDREVCIRIEGTDSSQASCFKPDGITQRTYRLLAGEYKVYLYYPTDSRPVLSTDPLPVEGITIRVLESGECEYARSRRLSC